MLHFTGRAVLLAASLFSLVACGGGGGGGSATPTTANSSTPGPTLTLSGSPNIVEPGQSTTITWTTSNVESCTASGAWSGNKTADGGSESVAPDTTTDFRMSCEGPGGRISRTLSITVQVAKGPPSVDLSTSEELVISGDRVQLTWSSDAAVRCTAQGAWSGEVALQGSQLSAPVQAASTFSLTCSNSQGSTVAMTQVEIGGWLRLNWQAPTSNIDGSPLTDLAGYRVYYGLSSRNYTSSVDVTDPNTTSVNLFVPAGVYYLALTAIDKDGNESGYSNELIKETE